MVPLHERRLTRAKRQRLKELRRRLPLALLCGSGLLRPDPGPLWTSCVWFVTFFALLPAADAIFGYFQAANSLADARAVRLIVVNLGTPSPRAKWLVARQRALRSLIWIGSMMVAAILAVLLTYAIHHQPGLPEFAVTAFVAIVAALGFFTLLVIQAIRFLEVARKPVPAPNQPADQEPETI